MKLYLSSYHMGELAAHLGQLFKNKNVALISNALDFSFDLERRQRSTEVELVDLRSIGLSPQDLDLREYFGKKEALQKKLSEFGGVWVRGGNCFVLRRAMKYSGFDEIILKLSKSDEFVYSGYSAGVCVITPTLKGIELVDDAQITPEKYQSEIIWNGIGLVNYSFAPHYCSDHPESQDIEKCVQYFIDNKMLFKALKDGEVLLEEVK